MTLIQPLYCRGRKPRYFRTQRRPSSNDRERFPNFRDRVRIRAIGDFKSSFAAHRERVPEKTFFLYETHADIKTTDELWNSDIADVDCQYESAKYTNLSDLSRSMLRTPGRKISQEGKKTSE